MTTTNNFLLIDRLKKKNNNLNNRNSQPTYQNLVAATYQGIDMLAATCSTSELQVYNFIKDKTIDESKLQVIDVSYEPPIGTAKWYLIKADGVNVIADFIGFADRRGASLDSFISIYTHGGWTGSDCCKTNPVKDCVCSSNTNFQCVGALNLSRGSGAIATATLLGDKVNSITVTNGGSGYTVVPTVIIASPGPSGTIAAATAILLGDKVNSITVTNGGSGYTVAPVVGLIPQIDVNVPASEIDYAMSTLPVQTNWILYGAIGVGLLVGLYLLTRKK